MAKDRSKTSGLIRVHTGLATHFVCPRWTFRSHVFCEVLEHTLPYFLSILELHLCFMYMRALMYPCKPEESTRSYYRWL